LKVSFVKIVFSVWTNYETLPLACFGCIMYFVLVLLKVALVNFTLNEYIIKLILYFYTKRNNLINQLRTTKGL